MLTEHGELSRAEIANLLGLSDWSINRWLGQMLRSGDIELTTTAKRSPLAQYRLKPSQGATNPAT